jgi:hypothetical protein
VVPPAVSQKRELAAFGLRRHYGNALATDTAHLPMCADLRGPTVLDEP